MSSSSGTANDGRSVRVCASVSNAVNPYGDAQRACRASTRIFASRGRGATCSSTCSKEWSSSEGGTVMTVVT